MLDSQQLDELMCVVASLNRDALVQQFQLCRTTFPIDFTPEFFETMPLERLRHIFVALCVQSRHLPEIAAAAAEAA